MPAMIGLLAVLALSGGAAKGQTTAPFPDVPKNHWAFAAVMDLKDRGILVGYPPEQAAPASTPRTGGDKARAKPAPRVRNSRGRASRRHR